MVGQAFGAGNPDRAQRAVWRTCSYNLWFLGLDAHGGFLAITVAFSTLAVVSAVLFRHGRWRTRRV